MQKMIIIIIIIQNHLKDDIIYFSLLFRFTILQNLPSPIKREGYIHMPSNISKIQPMCHWGRTKLHFDFFFFFFFEKMNVLNIGMMKNREKKMLGENVFLWVFGWRDEGKEN